MRIRTPSHTIPWRERAAAVEAARMALHRRTGDVGKNRKAFEAAFGAMYPEWFQTLCAKLKRGDPTGLDIAIGYLEADPHSYRSGYLRVESITAVKRLPLTAAHEEQLRSVVLRTVDRRDGRDLRHVSRLARRVDSPEFRILLEARELSDSLAVRRRAGWMLAAIRQPQ